MPVHKCPACGVNVKVENLDGHLARVHPGTTYSIDLSDDERRIATRARRALAPRFRMRRSTLLGAIIVTLAVVGVAVALPYLPAPRAGGGMAMHLHPNLAILIDGQTVVVPAQIGIDSSLWNDHSLDGYGMTGMAPLHTHDASGTIHEESNVVRDFTVGDFFRIWGQTFDPQGVLGHLASVGHRVWMVVDGAEQAPSYSLVMHDGMQIEIVCGAT